MIYRTDNNTGFWRKLCWDEENRLTTVRNMAEEPNNLSSYIYNAGGERTWKLTGNVMSMYINGQGYVDGVEFEKTLYVNPYLVITEEGYTKHFYIEGERVCSQIGGSGWVGPTGPNSPPLDFIVNDASSTATYLWEMVKRGVECSEFNPENVVITPAFQTFHIRYTFPETDLYFYHPDHLGSSSFITDAIGYASQHLQYLPFGETFVDQQNGYDSRYTFSAKEKDDETQYSYFGARYYDSDLSVWLSIDRFADKYPNLSPYNYCAWNPIKYIDPTGDTIGVTDKLRNNKNAYEGYLKFMDSRAGKKLQKLYGEGGRRYW
jgi:RHS repeat-associated protein